MRLVGFFLGAAIRIPDCQTAASMAPLFPPWATTAFTNPSRSKRAGLNCVPTGMELETPLAGDKVGGL